MRDRLQRRFLVRKEVARQGSYEGVIPLTELTRIIDMIEPETSGQQVVNVRFDFSLNEFDSQQIAGELEACLSFQCQRCLDAMDFPVTVRFCLLVDADDQMVQASGIDSVVSDDGYLDLYDVIEDELILAVPLITVHENEDCNDYWPDSVDDSVERESPFAVLKGLKT